MNVTLLGFWSLGYAYRRSQEIIKVWKDMDITTLRETDQTTMQCKGSQCGQYTLMSFFSPSYLAPALFLLVCLPYGCPWFARFEAI